MALRSPGFRAGEDALEAAENRPARSPFRRWLLDTGTDTRRRTDRPRPWWQVICLTGVDYFSSLGYQPGIAVLAAGLLSPLATVILVIATLAGALPVYRRVARESFRGEGSIAMLESLLSGWTGKLVVLVLLGFAMTDFIITITLSTSDAAAHVTNNPAAPTWLSGTGWQVGLTITLVVLLCGIFLAGFGQAITVAVVLVVAFLGLNVVVITVSLAHIADHPAVLTDWWRALSAAHGNPVLAVGLALLVFPKLALGLSGFETGVAVEPEIRGDPDDTDDRPLGRIRGTRRLLTTSAVVMSVVLLTSSLVTVVLIPESAFRPGGPADGRALSYLAHAYLGPVVANIYDISTITILWFAGASAMAGLINLIPRYLPRYGMAPRWAASIRPLVIAFGVIAIGIVIIFRADVNAQGGAYGTGVLALITSAAVAATISAARERQRPQTIGFAVITLAFVYTTVANIIQRSDGIRIAGFFIAGILITSALSRLLRSFQLRATSITLDGEAENLLMCAARHDHRVRIIAAAPDEPKDRYLRTLEADRTDGGPASSDAIFLVVHSADASAFEEDLAVSGSRVDGYNVLSVTSANVPNTIASTLLAVRDLTGVVPDVYFSWSEGRLGRSLLRYQLFGDGETALVTREVLLEAEENAARRPRVHAN